MASFEEAFAEVERIAAEAGKAARALQQSITKLGRAAKEGDLAKVRRTAGLIAPAIEALQPHRERLSAPWPMSADEELARFRNHFKDEFLAAAEAEQLDVSDQGRVLLVDSTSIRLRDEEAAIVVNNKKSWVLRPKRLAAVLKGRLRRKPKHEPAVFLEALHNAYLRRQRPGAYGRDVNLADLYEDLTLLPTVKRAYSWGDFRRDLLALRISGLAATRKGVGFAFTAGTRVKGEAGRKAITLRLTDRSTEILLAIRFEGGLL